MTCAGAEVALGPENEPATRIELMPTGSFILRDRAGNLGKISAKVSDPAALIQRSLASAAGGMLPIDIAQGLDDLGTRDGRAAGWIKGLSSEGGKIMADVEWTAAGRAALEGKEYRFISPTFYSEGNGGEVSRIARAGLTNVPALPELKQVASQAVPEPFAEPFAEFAQALSMPAGTDAVAILKAIGVVLKQPGKTGLGVKADTPEVTQATPEIDQLSVVLASALNLPNDATNDEIVTALLCRDATQSVAMAAAELDGSAFVPISAVATIIADTEKKRHEDYVEHAVTAAMQSGSLPPALEDWGRDLCRDKPDEFQPLQH